MSQRQLFAVLVKTLALWELVVGLQAVPLFIGQSAQFWHWRDDAEFFAMMIGILLSNTVIRLLSAVALWFGAAWLADKACPEPVAAGLISLGTVRGNRLI
jgi:hypothetical protein